MQVHRRPVVGLLSTGDELVEPSTQQLQVGQIRDANRAMLLAAVQQSGAETLDLGIAQDTQEQVEASFNQAVTQQADVLITTGCLHTPRKLYPTSFTSQKSGVAARCSDTCAVSFIRSSCGRLCCVACANLKPCNKRKASVGKRQVGQQDD